VAGGVEGEREDIVGGSKGWNCEELERNERIRSSLALCKLGVKNPNQRKILSGVLRHFILINCVSTEFKLQKSVRKRPETELAKGTI
jgi:hypothetical protein